MAEATTNSTANVSVGKGVQGGYFFSAPATPTNLAKIADLSNFETPVLTSLTDGAVLGYISEDGWVFAEERDSESHVDVNGETVVTATTSKTDTVAATLIEIKAATLKEWYGQSNVTDAKGLITAMHTADDAEVRIYVADLLLRNGRRWRSILPQGQVTEIGELTVASSELVGRETTITANAWTDSAGKTYTIIDYIQSTETEASAG